MKTLLSFLTLALVAIHAPVAEAQVLGGCGDAEGGEAAVKTAPAPVADAAARNPVLRPGDQAIDFELTAVIGDEIKPVKLSDSKGKWRVLCFYPADFTFV
jgi:hypothetical protein